MEYPKLTEEKDRRIRIPKDQHEVIRLMWDEGNGMSIHGIAREYSVNKRTIQFILFPERLKIAKANRDWRRYYDKDKWKDIMKEHRHYKKSVQGEELNLWRKMTRKD